MKLVFIYGIPGVGKLTVAKELAKLTGYKLFHNHLTVDLVESIFDFGSEPFIKLREEIWLKVFEYCAKYNISGLIFTFAFEKTASNNFITNVKNTMINKNNLYFIELICDKNVLKQRIIQQSRRKYGKLTDPEKLERWLNDGTYYTPTIGEALKIDTTNLSAEDTARKIMQFNHL